jgi:chitinase
VFAPSKYDSRLYLLKNPEEVATSGYTSMAAGLWFYMTPQDPKPSMHDVMTGNFTPTAADDEANIKNSFGTTINIINGGLECNSWSSKAKSRGEYYLKWLNFFGLDAEGDLGCETQKSFPDGGYGD